MKRAFILMAFALSLPALCFAQKDRPYLEKQFSVGSNGNVTVETSGGNISVSGGQNGSARVEMYVRAGDWKDRLSDDEIEERLANYDITIEQRGNTIYAVAKRKSGTSWKRNLSISFDVYVPRNYSSQVNTSGGNISISGLSGEQDLNTSGGNISVSEVEGNSRVNTSGGNISIDRFDGKLAVECSGGNISLKQANGDLKVHTSGGNINVSNTSGSLDAETSGGNIGVEITKLDKYLTLATSGGNISARIPDNLGMDLDVRGDRVHTNLQSFSGYLGKEKVQGKANGGGIPVKIRTSGGNISLN